MPQELGTEWLGDLAANEERKQGSIDEQQSTFFDVEFDQNGNPAITSPHARGVQITDIADQFSRGFGFGRR